MRKQNSSRDQLIKSADRRLKHLMIACLEAFEDRFTDIEDTSDGQKFKACLRTVFNDVMRAQRDEFYEYDVEYRPLKVDEDGNLSITKTFLETVQKIEFGINDLPYVKIFGAKDRGRVLSAIRSEFTEGAIYEDSDSLVLEIVGIDSCVNCVLPILDKYRLHSVVREKYKAWRQELINLYRS